MMKEFITADFFMGVFIPHLRLYTAVNNERPDLREASCSNKEYGDAGKMDTKFNYEDICLKTLTDDQTEEYLNCKRHASVFSGVYEKLNETGWNYMKTVFLESIHDENIRRLIYDPCGECIGFIELEQDTDGTRGINIGILPAYRKRDAATIASKKFIKYLFSERNIPSITWYAYESNTASRKVAEKLGGKFTGYKDNLKKVMENTNVSDENAEILNAFRQVTYLIEKQN